MNTIEFYDHGPGDAGEQRVNDMASRYDVLQQIKSNDGITLRWAEPRQDKPGNWLLQKPHHLDCSHVGKCFPDAVVRLDSDIDWPDPVEP